MIYYTSFSFTRLFDRIVPEAGPSQRIIFVVSKRYRVESETRQERNNHQRDKNEDRLMLVTLRLCRLVLV